MIEALFNQPTYVATRKMMDATALRHEAIASNIANIETPGYKRIDVNASFAQELKAAIHGQDIRSIKQVNPRLVEDSLAVSSRGDGNNVNLEEELLKLNQNTFAHALETQMVTGTLMKLRLAITGRAG